MSQPMWWYTVRASGLVAWAILAASVAWGLWLSARPARRPRPAWILDLHRFLGALGLVFVVIHLVGLSFDRFVGFGPTDLLVPFASHWRPGAVAWGVIAMDLVLAVELTSVAMRLLPRRLWHGVHLVSIAAYGLATAHVFTAGTDASSPLVLAFAIVATGVVAAMLLARLVIGLRRRVGVEPRVPVLPPPTSITWVASATEGRPLRSGVLPRS